MESQMKRRFLPCPVRMEVISVWGTKSITEGQELISLKMPKRGEEVKQKVQGEGGPLKAKGMDLLCLDYCKFPGTVPLPPQRRAV